LRLPAVLASLACLGATVASGPERIAAEMRTAIIARDAEAVMGCLSAHAQQRYRDLYRIARAGDGAAASALAPDERALVGVLRRRAGRELQASADLDAFLAAALVRGDSDTSILERIALAGTRATRGGGAQAFVVRDGVPTGVQVAFVREKGIWRVDRVGSPLLDPLALRLASAATGLDEDAVVDQLIARIAGD
jgi:hypothetical protein